MMIIIIFNKISIFSIFLINEFYKESAEYKECFKKL